MKRPASSSAKRGRRGPSRRVRPSLEPLECRTLPASSLLPGGIPSAAAVGDVNSDGRPHIVTASAEAGSVSVLLGAEGGRFAPRREYSVTDQPVSLALGDVNGDGRLDIVTATQAG